MKWEKQSQVSRTAEGADDSCSVETPREKHVSTHFTGGVVADTKTRTHGEIIRGFKKKSWKRLRLKIKLTQFGLSLYTCNMFPDWYHDVKRLHSVHNLCYVFLKTSLHHRLEGTARGRKKHHHYPEKVMKVFVKTLVKTLLESVSSVKMCQRALAVVWILTLSQDYISSLTFTS